MIATTNFLLAMLAIGMVTAKTETSSQNCPQQDITLQGDGDDLKYFSQCTDFSYKLTIGPKVTNVDLSDVQSIKGGIDCSGATQLYKIKATKLTVMGGTFLLNGLTILTSLEMPELATVAKLIWRTLPALQNLNSFGPITHAESIEVSDTRLENMSGFSKLVSLKSFNTNNNRSLKLLQIPLENIYDILNVDSNGKGLQADFSHLVWANNITLRDTSMATFPKLETVNSSASFISDTFSSIEFPQLTSVGGSFSFVGCPMLTQISAKNVTEIGGTFLVANNTKLTTIDGFTSLKKVGGSVDMAGRFKNATLPGLKDGDVRGSFNMQTTEAFDCAAEFDKLQADDIVQGEYICDDKKEKASSLTTDGLTTDGTGSGNKDSSAVRTTISFALVVGASFAVYWGF